MRFFSLGIVVLTVAATGCGGDVSTGKVDSSPSDGVVYADLGPSWEGGGPGSLTISPRDPELVVESGAPLPTQTFVALLDDQEVTARWSVDQGEFGDIDNGGTFTPSGAIGGKVNVTAAVGSMTATTSLMIRLVMTQNGATADNGDPGPGGFGGVGGEGLGLALSPTDVALLTDPGAANGGVSLLYPYDETVWPLGLLAPLIQWSQLPEGTGEGVLVSLSTDGFSFEGTFGRPDALPDGVPFVRHPLPQNVWKVATRSAAGGTLTLEVKVLSSGKVYGPLTQNWRIAKGSLRGTVYYQSYGTNLAKNYSGALGGDGRFGGATLAIRGSSANPSLVAGTNGGHDACRVCHSVSSDGSRMVVQHGDDYKASSAYDLFNGASEALYPAGTSGRLGWVGMTPDGELGLGNAAPIPGEANTTDTALYEMASGAPVATTGLSSFVTKAGFPMFSPDGQRVAFAFYRGPGDGASGPGDGTQLVVMDFDATARAFSAPRVVYAGDNASLPGWPAFWPTGEALLFQAQLQANRDNEYFATRYGARGELRWVDLASGTSHPLDRLNGGTYLPTGPNNHDRDAELGYEPTVSPIASGGYAWVVFVSRRMYGNVATIDPWASDPREHDLTSTPTPKKLWVAALDLNAQPGSDPSHPAFYLPGQELLAGNSRGFWVTDPCKDEGATCEGGDECCEGYCSHRPSDGVLVCGRFGNTCANEHDKCERDEDCCDFPTFKCINERCARWTVQ